MAIFAVLGSSPAQNLQTLISGLFAGAEEGSKAEPPASEQLVWAEEQRAEAEKLLQEIQSPEWVAEKEAAGWEAETRAEIQKRAREVLETWTSAIGTLQAVILREQMAGNSMPPVAIPKTPREAEGLESRMEELQQQLATASLQKQTLEQALSQAQQALRQRVAEVGLAEEEIRAAGEDAGRAARARAGLMLAQMGKRVAEAQIFSLRWQQYREDLERESLSSELERTRAALQASGLDKVLSVSRAASRLEQVRRALPALEKALQEAERQLSEISGQVEKWRKESDDAARAQLEAALPILEIREFLHRVARGRVTAARQEISLWERVEKVASDPSISALDRARTQTLEDISALSAAQSQLENRLGGLLRQTEEAMSSAGGAEPGGRKSAGSRALADLRETAQREGLALKSRLRELEGAHRRVLAALEAELERLRREQTLGMAWHRTQTSISNFLNIAVFSAAGRTFTLGGLLLAVLALTAAIIGARMFSAWFSRVLARRFHLGQSQSHLLEKLTLYSLTVILTFTVLQWLNIPLTIFAFLGGALAVGVGFGSQTLINNFISGLLLLLERKINVGDLVEVDGRIGRVTSLGSRCSTIQLFDGVEVLVPNSLLLEKIVINWTLSDPLHRYEVRVGIAYGSDLDLAFSILREAVSSVPEILPHPEPGIYFVNFGESSLDFLVYYWLEVGRYNPLEVGSNLRRTIQRLFRERGLEIPFPQREVRVVSQPPSLSPLASQQES